MVVAIHPNEGFVLLGAVKILTGMTFIMAVIFIKKLSAENRALAQEQKKVLAIATSILLLTLGCIDFYLELTRSVLRDNLILIPFWLLFIFGFMKDKKNPYGGVAALAIGMILIYQGLKLILI